MKDNKKILPELCFPGFEELWIYSRMGDLFSFKITNSFSRDNLNYKNGMVKNIHYGDIHTKFQTLFDATIETVPFINPNLDIQKIKEDNYCQEGDLVFADASEDLADVGKSIEIINLNNERLVSGLHTILARPNSKFCHSGFLGYLFKSDFIRKQIQKESQGSKVLSISATRLSNLIIHYPLSTINSAKIASCLSSIDEVITAHIQKLEVLKDHKKGLMQNLFPHASTGSATAETVPKWRFKEFENDGEWEEKMLGDMTLKIGSGVTPSGGEAKYKESGRPFVRSQNVGWGIFILDNVVFIDEETHQNSKNTEIELEDVLLNITGASIGRSVVANHKVAGGNVNQHVCIIRTQRDSLEPNFLCQYLISNIGQKQIGSFQAGGNRQGLNFAQIRSFIISIPTSIKEQQKIANCLSSLDALITAQSEKIEQLKLHKKGLMQGVFPKVND
jgi:type I restriction enzyme S subunit